MRQSNESTVARAGKRSRVPAYPMLVMDGSIIEDGIGARRASICGLPHRFVPLEERIDDRGHLPGDTSEHVIAANTAAQTLIGAALPREEFLVETLPLAALHLDRPGSPSTRPSTSSAS
jgi:hypothetical protein